MNLVFSNFVYNSFRSQVDVIYIDLYIVFDTNNNELLIQTQKRSDVGEPLLSCFKSYLIDRRQRINLFNFRSNIFSALSGVSQGRFLNCSLFVLTV